MLLESNTNFPDASTYIVLRELHKVEMAIARESEINRIIQQVIDIMISDDIGLDQKFTYKHKCQTFENIIEKRA